MEGELGSATLHTIALISTRTQPSAFMNKDTENLQPSVQVMGSEDVGYSYGFARISSILFKVEVLKRAWGAGRGEGGEERGGERGDVKWVEKSTKKKRKRGRGGECKMK